MQCLLRCRAKNVAYSFLFTILLFSSICDHTLVQGIVLEGSQTSYAQFHQWHGGINSTLELEFRTAQSDCLLLYTDNSGGVAVEGTGGSREYLLISLVAGEVRLRYNWGAGPYVFTVGGGKTKFNDNSAFHHLVVIKSGSETTVVVDRVYTATSSAVSASKLSALPTGGDAANNQQPAKKRFQNKKRKRRKKGGNNGNRKKGEDYDDASDFIFGNASTNSYVYVGGLPSWYAEKMEILALPIVLLEPRFRGEVKGLRYRDLTHQGVTLQSMMAYKVRRS